jgi:lipopolysaccharide transport system ATP-binding protein
MNRAEIKQKFDEIVDFAEVEKFLDTPVKRYSSGMYVRLAFAVAAHLEPEILVIDEVLAVGDAQFQKKCLGKMNDVSNNEGKTILFVSHNMPSIISLCNKGMILSEGIKTFDGEIQNVIDNYSNTNLTRVAKRIWDIKEAPGDEKVKLLSVCAINKNKIETARFDVTELIGIKIEYEVLEEGNVFWHGINFFNEEGLNIFDSHSVTSKWYNTIHPIGKFETIAWLTPNFLNEGIVIVNIAIFNHEKHKVHLHEKDVINFFVCDYFLDGNLSARGRSTGRFPGIIRPLLKWTT